jgi:hypothetical protein
MASDMALRRGGRWAGGSDESNRGRPNRPRARRPRAEIASCGYTARLQRREAEENAASEYGPLGAIPRNLRAKGPKAPSEENDGLEDEFDYTEGNS